MIIIKQSFEHSCVLACFQSFLADNFITYTQSQMVHTFPEICNKGTEIEGSICLSSFDSLAKNLHTKPITLKNLPREIKEGEALFLITTKPTIHCVRLYKPVSENEILVINPRLNMGCEKFEYDKWNIKQIEESMPVLKLVKLDQNQSSETTD